MNYLKKILTKSGWVSLSSAFFLVLQLIAYLIIPRYVPTVDIGCFAIASAFVLTGLMIIEYAFNSSIIHHKEIDRPDYRAVFRLNLCVSIIVILIGVIATLIISYRSHRFLFLYLFLGLSPILILCSNISVQYAAMRRALRFKMIAISDVIGNLLYFFCLITLLYFQFGVWALMVAYLFKYSSILLWLIISDWTYTDFSFKAEKRIISRHYNYGKYIIGEKGLSSVLSYADSFVVGHFFGLHVLGIYDILKKAVIRPISAMYSALESVIFPLLSKEQDRPFHFNIIFRDFMAITRLVFIPVFFVIFLFGEQLIRIFPPDYHDYASLIRAIAFFGISVIIANPIDILLYSKGKTKTFFRWQLGISIPYLAVMILASYQGIHTMIVAMGLFYVIIYLASYFLMNREGLRIKISSYYSPVLSAILLFFIWIFVENYFSVKYPEAVVCLLMIFVLAVEGLRYLRQAASKAPT